MTFSWKLKKKNCWEKWHFKGQVISPLLSNPCAIIILSFKMFICPELTEEWSTAGDWHFRVVTSISLSKMIPLNICGVLTLTLPRVCWCLCFKHSEFFTILILSIHPDYAKLSLLIHLPFFFQIFLFPWLPKSVRGRWKLSVHFLLFGLGS